MAEVVAALEGEPVSSTGTTTGIDPAIQPTNWATAQSITLSTLSGERVSLASILEGGSGTDSPSRNRKTVLVFLRKFSCPTCYSYILLFSHLRPVLVSKSINIAFVTCHTSLSEVRVFIKAFAFWLKSIGDADGLSPLPGTLYLDPERKTYAFFGIGMKMSAVRGLRDVLGAKLRGAFGLLKRPSATPSVASSELGTPGPAAARSKGKVLSRIIFGIGLRLPELADNARDETLFQSPGIVLVQNQTVLYRFVSTNNEEIMSGNTADIARTLTGDIACALPEETPADLAYMLAQFSEKLESPETSAKVNEKELEFGERLGAGRIATVYRSRWLGMDVAVKYFNTREEDEGTENSRSLSFTNEVSIMMSLRHPSICTLMGFGLRNSRLFLVMELVDNGSLFDLIASGIMLSSVQKHVILVDIAKGMKYLHGCSPTIIHQDLKSLNILMTQDLHAKISDFGIASESRRIKSAGPSASESDLYDINEQAHGGTFPWMSPEYIQGTTPPSTKWDVFAFAVIAWEVATMKKPWYKCTRDFLIKKVMSGERLAIEIRWQWSPKFVSLVTDCWHHNPNSRPNFNKIVKRLADSWLVVPV